MFALGPLHYIILLFYTRCSKNNFSNYNVQFLFTYNSNLKMYRIIYTKHMLFTFYRRCFANYYLLGNTLLTMAGYILANFNKHLIQLSRTLAQLRVSHLPMLPAFWRRIQPWDIFLEKKSQLALNLGTGSVFYKTSLFNSTVQETETLIKKCFYIMMIEHGYFVLLKIKFPIQAKVLRNVW